MRNLLLMLVSCSDRGRGLFSREEREKSLIIYTATLDHSLNFSWVYLQSVHFHPDWVSSASVSIYKACGLTAGSSTDLTIDSQWCEGLEADKAEQSRHGSSVSGVIQTLALSLFSPMVKWIWSTKTTDISRVPGYENFHTWTAWTVWKTE